jgi:hypothetical protein
MAEESAGQSYSLALEARSHREYPLMILHLERTARQGHLSAQERLGIALLAGESLWKCAKGFLRSRKVVPSRGRARKRGRQSPQ